MKLGRALDEAASRLRGWSRVRVVAHHDADGLAAASVLCMALARRSVAVHVSAVGRISEELRSDLAEEEAVVFCDLGSQAAGAGGGRAETLHLDHHPLTGGLPGLMVNPWLDGLDGTDAVSSAGLAFEVARRLGPCGDLAPIAIAGALSDRQPIEGMNRAILEEGVRAGSVRVGRGLRIPGDSRTPVRDVLLRLAEPWTEIAGDPRAVDRLLESLSIDGSVAVRALPPEASDGLGRALEGLSRSSESRPIIDAVYSLPGGAVGEARLLGETLNSAGYLGETSVGIALACGDRSFRERGLDLWRRFQERLVEALRGLQVQDSRVFRIARAPDRRLGGALASAAARRFPADRPLLVVHDDPSGVKVSARALRPLRERGIHLGEALGRAAASVGGTGGGHPVASGATLPPGSLEAFLREAEETVAGQLGGA